MNKRVRLTIAVIRREQEAKGSQIAQRQRRNAFLWLTLGVVVGSIVRILYLIIEHGESFRFISLVTAITSAVIILGFSKGVVRWLDEATPWWSQFLIGFSIGFLGQVLLKEIVEEVS